MCKTFLFFKKHGKHFLQVADGFFTTGFLLNYFGTK